MSRTRLLVLLVLFILPSGILAGVWGMRIAENPGGAGARITAVTPGGAARSAGLRAGDLITHAGGRKVLKAGDLAHLLKAYPAGKAIALTVSRGGWEKDVRLTARDTPVAGTAGGAPTPAPPSGSMATAPPRPSAGDRGGPTKAAIAVGDFQAKAAQSANYIGDGLREMLLTSLHGSGRFLVVERIDIKGIAAEQALSRSAMAREDQAIPSAQMDVADLLIYGAVTEFEAEASGSDFGLGGGGSTPLSFGAGGKESHMAIDIRVADVRTGRLVLAKRFVGKADASRASLGVSPSIGGRNVPFSVGGFRNTPMERAIRDCVVQATRYVANHLPRQYFRHY